MASTKAFTAEEQKRLIAGLEVPFDPNLIKWRVMKTAQGGRRGSILPFADPRAYSDRLNYLLTPGGWKKECAISNVPSLCRTKNGKVIVTGKVLMAVAVTIHKMGAHTGTGEEWADEENAATSAEAQAFKRACSSFGLGRYLYRFTEVWVSLDREGRPKTIPILPTWALPPGWVPSGTPDQGQSDVRGPIDHRLTSRIITFQRVLGDALFLEILERAGHSNTAKNIPNAERQKNVAQWMEAAVRGLERARSLAQKVGEAHFASVMDTLKIESTTSVPSLDTLKCLVDTLESISDQHAA
jgi:hypothetical protein